MQRCFIINEPRKAIEVNDVEYNKINRTIKGINSEGDIVKANADDVIIIDNEIELNIFMKEYEVI